MKQGDQRGFIDWLISARIGLLHLLSLAPPSPLDGEIQKRKDGVFAGLLQPPRGGPQGNYKEGLGTWWSATQAISLYIDPHLLSPNGIVSFSNFQSKTGVQAFSLIAPISAPESAVKPRI
jgi:hypothetical protein